MPRPVLLSRPGSRMPPLRALAGLLLLLSAGAACWFLRDRFGPSSSPSEPPSRAMHAEDADVELPPEPPPLPVPDPALWREKRDFLSSLPASLAPQEAIEAADRAKEIGDVRAARDLSRRALSGARSDVSLLVATADAERGLLRANEARALYLQARKLDASRMEPYTGLANLAQTAGDHAEAWRWLQAGMEAAAKPPASAGSYLALARTYQDFNDAAGAEIAVKRALELSPDDPRAHAQMASLLLNSGRLAECRALLDRLLAAHPDNVRGCRLLAECITNPANDRSDYTRARQLLEKAVTLSPRNAEAFRTLGLVYRHFNLPRLAARAYDSVLRLEPESVDARYTLGQLYVSLGQTDVGRAQMALCAPLRQRERELDRLYVAALKQPRRLETRLALGHALEDRGRFAGAVWEYGVSARRSAEEIAEGAMRSRVSFTNSNGIGRRGYGDLGACLLWLIAAMVFLAQGCNKDRPPPVAGTAAPAGRVPQGCPVQFADVTKRAGIDWKRVNGAFGLRWFPETTGGGGAFIDYDGDGYPDILLVNGDWWPGHAPAGRPHPTMALYRNNGNGTFTDVFTPPASTFRARGWASRWGTTIMTASTTST